jgi:DNA-directed RNA polymerase
MTNLMYSPPTAEELALEELWEEHMVVLGRDQRLAADRKAAERGSAGSTKSGRYVISGMVDPLASMIREEIDRLSEGRVKRKPPELASLLLLPPRDSAAIALRCVVDFIAQYGEEAASVQRVGQRIGKLICAETIARILRKEERPLFEARVKQIAERTSNTSERVRQILKAARQVAEAAERGEDAQPLTMEEIMTGTEMLRLGSSLVMAMVSLGFIEEQSFKLSKTHTKRYIAFTQETAEALQKAGLAASLLRPTFLPTIIPPKPWTSMSDGGYWRKGRMSRLMVKRSASNGVKTADAEHMPRMFEALNFLQNTPWRINKKVLAVVEYMRKMNIAEAGLPPSQFIPLPPVPHDIDTNEDARKVWRTAARKVREANRRIQSTSLACDKVVLVAQDMADYPSIWFPKVIDFRGRVYDLPLFLKPQGDDLSKGILEFGNGKALGEGGGYWLAIHGANTYGVDKVPLDDRVEWVLQNEEAILRVAEDPIGERFWTQADKPFQFLAFCYEWAAAREAGDGFVSHLPIAMDGSCNGLQHLSAMLRDPIGGAAVNLLPSERPSDIYSVVLKVAVADLEGKAKGGDTVAAQWLPVMARGVVKRPVMTLPYGATRQGFADQIVEDTIRPIEKAGASPFGTGGPMAAQYLSHIVWASTGQVVVAARVAMDWLQSVAKVAAEANVPLQWTTPTGFKVRQDYRDDKTREVELLTFGQRIRVMVADGVEDRISKRRMAMAIAPNFVHSMDAGHMLRTVEFLTDRGRQDMHLSMVHDSYATHASDTEALAFALRQAFVEMYQERCWLTSFRDEIISQLPETYAEKVPEVPAQGDLDITDVLNSLYFFA